MNAWGRKAAAVAASFAITVSLAIAEDEVQRLSANLPIRGTITAENAAEVSIQRKDNGKTETIPVNDIAKVKYEGGKVSAEFIQAESLERGGEYQKAMDAYGKIAQENAKKEFLSRAAQFGRVSSLVALAQRDASKMDDAIESLEEFNKQHADSRFHYTLHEMLGKLYLAKNNRPAATTAFQKLAEAPWPELKLKATNYAGQMLLQNNQPEQALAKFDSVIQAAGDSTGETLRRAEAQIGKAQCQMLAKQPADAEKLLRDVIANVAQEEAEIRAPAHNLLGDLLRDTGRADQAIFDYLYVDIYYSNQRDEHAKALCYIALLFEQRGQNDRAEEMRQRLKRDYPASPWVQVSEGSVK